jgi:hypothetical protein
MLRDRNQTVVKQIIGKVVSRRLQLITILLLQSIATCSLAQDVDSILVLHANFQQSKWNREFNAEITEVLSAIDNNDVLIAF